MRLGQWMDIGITASRDELVKMAEQIITTFKGTTEHTDTVVYATGNRGGEVQITFSNHDSEPGDHGHGFGMTVDVDE
jgi:hypothetical protein